MSQISDAESATEYGHKFGLGIDKISGNFKISLNHETVTETFNPNDMGYLQVNNRMRNSAWFYYQTYKPYKRLLNWRSSLYIDNTFRCTPRHYIASNISLNGNFTFRNRVTFGYEFWCRPETGYDFDEPRIEGMYFNLYPSHSEGAWISTDYSKKIAGDIGGGYFGTKKTGNTGFWVFVVPRWQAGDKLFITYNFWGVFSFNDLGYAGTSDNEDISYFGKRNQNTVTNTLTAQYSVNNHSDFSLRVRHYWAPVIYQKFYQLGQYGDVFDSAVDYTTDDINFNAFNIDFIYTWEFAPGSFVTAAWKNQIYADNAERNVPFFKNLAQTLTSTQTNNISLKILYYFDYNYLKHK